MKNKRLVAAFLALLLICTLFFSFFFVAAKSNHDCVDKGCSICQEIQFCIQTIRSISTVVTATTTLVITAFFLVRFIVPIVQRMIIQTLVSLKVKLTN
ncbi:hypothetical protein [Anaerotignum sp. MB30-C6]|uniref:hypothetical protein n=1 Tax=Anaerotignum sp. MB30-C6 TaxID=3070814 RepID=UPI0027DD1A85|nr:hypothetical protein [Anaerotignum sp. MB30-C6]WMI79815.1 hypothetical protein RBQ60_08135 [Anaerotignum sp. MB30-C6]